ncbi:MAG: segregation/condensation protein A, partial [Methylovulum sp.]|nr:segregation/condensation protein A [Methylovulum sp.]
ARERMSTILESLKGSDSRLFTELFTRREGRHGVVVSFLAILELGKEGLIEITQPEPFAELRVRASQTARADL